jgi:hypothetical protein
MVMYLNVLGAAYGVLQLVGLGLLFYFLGFSSLNYVRRTVFIWGSGCADANIRNNGELFFISNLKAYSYSWCGRFLFIIHYFFNQLKNGFYLSIVHLHVKAKINDFLIQLL